MIINYIIEVKGIDINVASLRHAITCLRNNNFKRDKTVITRREVLKACIIKDPKQIDKKVKENLDIIFQAYPEVKILNEAYKNSILPLWEKIQKK